MMGQGFGDNVGKALALYAIVVFIVLFGGGFLCGRYAHCDYRIVKVQQ